MQLDWQKLIVPISHEEILEYIPYHDWQQLRLDMRDTSLEYKYHSLCGWLKLNQYSRASRVQVANYVNALKRGGLI